jgi:hypothetical protein
MTDQDLPCGPHCGIRSNAEGTVVREGHCDCETCHDGVYHLTGPVRLDDPRPHTMPMCQSWYEQAGKYRPWHYHVEGCTCGMNAHALPEQHGKHCPKYMTPDQRELLAKLTTGEPER